MNMTRVYVLLRRIPATEMRGRWIMKPLARLTAALAVSLLLSLSTEVATALALGNPDARLRGEYFLSLNQACVATPNGFNSDDLTPVVGTAAAVNFTMTGALRYHGDGTASFEGTSLFLNAGSFPVRQDNVTCDAPYSMSSDRRISQRFACQGTSVAGVGGPPPSGLPVGTVFSFEFSMQGQLGIGRQTVVFGDTSTDEETLMFPVPVNRICGRSGAAQRIGPAK